MAVCAQAQLAWPHLQGQGLTHLQTACRGSKAEWASAATHGWAHVAEGRPYRRGFAGPETVWHMQLIGGCVRAQHQHFRGLPKWQLA
eukprot:4417373-Amphidinium_carterae.1